MIDTALDDHWNVVAKRLFSADRVALVALFTIRLGPGSAMGRPGLSARPLGEVDFPALGTESTKLASVSGAEEFQKSLYTISASGMVPRSNTCDLMRSP